MNHTIATTNRQEYSSPNQNTIEENHINKREPLHINQEKTKSGIESFKIEKHDESNLKVKKNEKSLFTDPSIQPPLEPILSEEENTSKISNEPKAIPYNQPNKFSNDSMVDKVYFNDIKNWIKNDPNPDHEDKMQETENKNITSQLIDKTVDKSTTTTTFDQNFKDLEKSIEREMMTTAEHDITIGTINLNIEAPSKPVEERSLSFHGQKKPEINHSNRLRRSYLRTM